MVDAFTYEDIYELLRSEKFSADLQTINIEDLHRIQSYINDKKALLAQVEEDMNVLSTQKRAKIRLEIENAIRALKDLYEARERKVINRAVFTIRAGGDIKDTTNMLNGEDKLYSALLTLLVNSRDEFLSVIDGEAILPIPTQEAPASEPETPVEEPEEIAPISQPVEEPLPAMEPVEEPAEQAVEADGGTGLSPEETPVIDPEPVATIEMLSIEVTESCPECVGEDLKTYGPFLAGQAYSIPQSLAQVMIDQSKARKPGETPVAPEPIQESIPISQPTPVETPILEPVPTSTPTEEVRNDPIPNTEPEPAPKKELSDEEKAKLQEAQDLLRKMAMGGQ